MRKRTLFYFIFLLTLVFSGLFALAENAQASVLPARASLNGYASDFAVGETDVMLPISGSNSSHNFYFDPTVAIGSDNQGYADLGVG